MRRYYNRVIEDSAALTFVREAEKGASLLVVNSSQLRAVQGRQANDFKLDPINPPTLRQKHRRNARKDPKVQEVEYPTNQKWYLDPEIDATTRAACEST